jgi:hypothetical protein
VQHRRAKTPSVIDGWENLALYYSPPANYEVIGEVTGEVKGFRAVSRMGYAIEGMKRAARVEGATGVLVVVPADVWGPQAVAPLPAGTGFPVYAVESKATMYGIGVRIAGLAIYVPADADAFQKAAQAHAITCAVLSPRKDDMEDAYNAVKKTGTRAAIAAAQVSLRSAEDAADAANCGDDDWYAVQMTAQKH